MIDTKGIGMGWELMDEQQDATPSPPKASRARRGVWRDYVWRIKWWLGMLMSVIAANAVQKAMRI